MCLGGGPGISKVSPRTSALTGAPSLQVGATKLAQHVHERAAPSEDAWHRRCLAMWSTVLAGRHGGQSSRRWPVRRGYGCAHRASSRRSGAAVCRFRRIAEQYTCSLPACAACGTAGRCGTVTPRPSIRDDAGLDIYHWANARVVMGHESECDALMHRLSNEPLSGLAFATATADAIDLLPPPSLRQASQHEQSRGCQQILRLAVCQGMIDDGWGLRGWPGAAAAPSAARMPRPAPRLKPPTRTVSRPSPTQAPRVCGGTTVQWSRYYACRRL